MEFQPVRLGGRGLRSSPERPLAIIVDGGWAVSSMNFGPGMGTAQPGLEVGTTVRLQSIFGTFQNVTVVGIMKQQFFNGVFMNQDLVFSTYGAVGPSVLLIDFTSGLDVAEQAALVERQFLPWGVQTLNVQALAEAITSAIDSVFVLFRAFLAIGLVIGIVGLGIITIRSINERKLEIGMMRAIGFRKRMVVVNFAIESGFVAAIGIIIGTAMGIIIGYTIWKSNFMGDFEFPFVSPGGRSCWWPLPHSPRPCFASTLPPEARAKYHLPRCCASTEKWNNPGLTLESRGGKPLLREQRQRVRPVDPFYRTVSIHAVLRGA